MNIPVDNFKTIAWKKKVLMHHINNQFKKKLPDLTWMYTSLL